MLFFADGQMAEAHEVMYEVGELNLTMSFRRQMTIDTTYPLKSCRYTLEVAILYVYCEH